MNELSFESEQHVEELVYHKYFEKLIHNILGGENTIENGYCGFRSEAHFKNFKNKNFSNISNMKIEK